MIAQWRWRQAFIPQLDRDGEYIDSTEGGTVEVTSVIDKSDENYNDAYKVNGGKSYYAGIDELVIVKAFAKSGCKFIGWYDESGKLITTNAEYAYVEAKESIKTYYARFSDTVTQTYIRQIKSGDSWTDTTDDTIGTLDRYTYTDAVGKPISSTAKASNGYKFVGWYDSEGNKVADNMLINNGATISYTTTGNATYYARFEDAYTLVVSKIDGDQSTLENKVPLVGAEFTIYQKDDSGTDTIRYNDGESVKSIKCTKISSVTTALSADRTKATAVFADLLDTGIDYYLAETRAPAGYRLLDTPLKITIDGSGKIASIDGISQSITAKDVHVELANYLTLHMPISGFNITGGWYAAVGLTLLAAAAIGLFGLKISRLKKQK